MPGIVDVVNERRALIRTTARLAAMIDRRRKAVFATATSAGQ
jgi:hypothetical protein